MEVGGCITDIYKEKLILEINKYLKEVKKYDKSNGITDISYHNGKYKAIEEILEIVELLKITENIE